MELNEQIKKYRTEMNLSQEELAEKIYVTRQSISNWENGKTYPDIHSLLLLSSLFGISLDQLVKGDIEIMKAEIKKEEIAMVGDRLSTDIAFGLNNGSLSVMVLTGEATMEDVENGNIKPDIILLHAKEILNYIK